MPLSIFNQTQLDQIQKVAKKVEQPLKTAKKSVKKSVTKDLADMEEKVIEHFKDSKAILIQDTKSLNDYVDKIIAFGYYGIDSETTGLDRVNDTVVGMSLYVQGMPECYIPMKHVIPIFDQPYKDQLTYEEVGEALQRLAKSGAKGIYANADFDLAMIYKDLGVDFMNSCYFDDILAWRCIKEDELKNDLKSLYQKYVARIEGDSMRFKDFFTPELFPYCRPEVAKLYAANDAKITFEFFLWVLPYLDTSKSKCTKSHLEAISSLVWNVEMPLIKECQKMHRIGIYLDKDTANVLHEKYQAKLKEEKSILSSMVQDILDKQGEYEFGKKRAFLSGSDFNPESSKQVSYLLYDVMKLPKVEGTGTGKDILNKINMPVTNQILKVRSIGVLINTFVDKLPKSVGPDGRVHAQMKQIGASTGRFSSADPNMQNIPSHVTDIRHMFRASPGYVMLSSDYSSQEPKITAFVAKDEKMSLAFKEGKDIYATIASIAFGVPYEQCLEFHPKTGEYQKEGKVRRGEAKIVVLGICYGRSVITIAEQLYEKDTSLTKEEKEKKAQNVFDSVLNAFPNLRKLMISAQRQASKKGYVETILGRRRHIPDMMLPEFEFKPMTGYVNPDIDPLDISTLNNKSEIPDRIVASLREEFSKYKYFGQIVKRTKELADEKIRVINNRPKRTEASRQCVNCVDYETEILTAAGWKKYNEIHVGEYILSYSIDSSEIVVDTVHQIHNYTGEREVIRFESPSFSSASTEEHRWVVTYNDGSIGFMTTSELCENELNAYSILRSAGNSFKENRHYSKDALKLLGWILVNGSKRSHSYGLKIYQPVFSHRDKEVYIDMIRTLDSLSITYHDDDELSQPGKYHMMVLSQNEITLKIWECFPDMCLTYSFVSTLSQNQAETLMRAMLQCQGQGVDERGDDLGDLKVRFTVSSIEMCNVFQFLCVVAGYVSSYYKVDTKGDEIDGDIYNVTVHNLEQVNNEYTHIYKATVDGVWCVTTGTGTWIARRDGKVYITGNSIIQGRRHCPYSFNLITQGCAVIN